MRIIRLITFFIGWSLVSFAQTPTFVTDYQPTTFYNWQDAVKNASSASTLDLSGWRLETLPAEIGTLTKLAHLDLSNNPLSVLPNEVRQLQELESFAMENVITIEVKPLFQHLASLSNLKRLNLKNMSLMYLPITLDQLRQLTHLNLSGNQLKRLSRNFYYLSNLKTLDLSNNEFNGFEEKIKYLEQLKHLDLSYNPKLKTPKSVKYLDELKIKSLKWQGLKSVFDVIQRIPTLETLDLSEGLFSDFDLGNLERLKTLNLNGCKELVFYTVFNNLSKLDSLTTLHLEHNQATVSKGLGKLESLENLTLGSREMKLLPKDLSQLKNLKTLDLTNSSVLDWTKAIKELAKVRNLETLVLKGCLIKELPENIGSLKNVKHLELNANELTTLPNSFFKLKQLESLNLYGNPLDEATIKRLKKAFPNCEIQYPRSLSNGARQVKVTNTIHYKNQPKKIAPPLATAQIEEITNVVNANMASTINLESGTTIFVPENAFIDANGNPVKGKVAVSYREFNDPLSMYLSGIPMTYKTGGEIFQFKSAGMFQVTAAQNGEKVLINPERPLEVELDSYDDGEKFNLYQYDTIANRWQEIKDETEIVSTPNNTLETLQTAKDKIKEPTEPVAVEAQRVYLERIRSKTTPFSFRLNYKLHKRLNKPRRDRIKWTTGINEFEDVIWVYDGDDRQADFKLLRKIFVTNKSREKRNRKQQFRTHKVQFGKNKESYGFYFSDDIIDLRVTPNPSRDNYSVEFFTLVDTIRIAAYPNFRSTYRHAKEQLKNQEFYQLYTQLLEKRCKVWNKAEEEDRIRMEVYEQQMEDYRKIQLFGNAKNSITLLNARIRIVVRDDRIHNKDRPLQWEETVYDDPMILTFQDENRQKVTIDKIDILDGNNNTAIRIIRNEDLQKVRSLENATFIVQLNDGRVGVAKNLNLKKMSEGSTQQFVLLETRQKEKMTIDKLKELIACK